MRRIFIHSDILLAFLATEDSPTARRAQAAIASAHQTKTQLVTSSTVILAVVAGLEKRTPKLIKEDIAAMLTKILALFEFPERDQVSHAFAIWINHALPFHDALIVSEMHAQGIRTISSFNKRFDAVDGIVRLTVKRST